MHTATFPGRFQSLAKISEFVVQAAQEAGLDPAEIYAVDLAVDEACTNIIEHAYGAKGDGEIRCTCEDIGNSLVVKLYDTGRPFDPSIVPEPKISKKLEKLKPGGAGIFLMRKVMDDVKFEFGPSGNVLTMVKKKKKS